MPTIGDPTLLADAGLVLEPHLHRLASRRGGQRRLHQAGKVFLKAPCAAASFFGCYGRGCRRVRSSLRNRLATCVGEMYREMRDDLHPQINAAPANDFVGLRIGSFDHHVVQFGPLLLGQRRRPPRPRRQSPSRQRHLRCSDAPSRTASAGPCRCPAASPRGRPSSTSASPSRRRTWSASSIFTASGAIPPAIVPGV